MINTQAFSSSDCNMRKPRVYLLSKNIAAIQVLPCEGASQPRLGMITQLPQSAELELCGEGFNERTVRVKWADRFYFVFLQDLDSATPEPYRTEETETAIPKAISVSA